MTDQPNRSNIGPASGEYSLSTSNGVSLTLQSRVLGICPKHGEQRSCITVYLDIPERGGWCQQCWCEQMAATCQRLLPPEAP